MSLYAPQTKEEGKFQYCNYGYDKTKFKSFEDCMTNYNKVFYPATTTDSKEQVLAQSLSDYRANLPKVIEKYRFTKDIELFAWNGKEDFGFNINQPKIKFKKGDNVDGFIMPNKFQSEPPAYLVLTDKTKSDAMFRIANGGRGFKGYDFIEQISDSGVVSDAPAPPTKSGDAFFPKLAGSYNKNLIIAVVLVAGYFAYKKFKK